ncbi:hypothetical protein JYK02_34180 [Corallococcus macrosporus]|uniref:Uncharacterized protein n=1 Tax=Corallococcus macrosporus TaxID=35 RepID=A0ABS3DMK3_9BACT|nr:hypothetical protein [Corallococcus macrosporus]MBN8232578.1 hypothetical protein [Corallococcus macrosporus]
MALLVVMGFIAAVFALVASRGVFQGVVLFWYAWAVHVALLVAYLARRGLLLRQGRAGLFAKIDRLAVEGIQASGFIMAMLLFFRR